MASEDVIELGSSDEDLEPAPKKAKPMPNAMVCIPNTFKEVTITPSKSNLPFIPKGLGKAVTVTKLNHLIANPFANKSKVNGKPNPKVLNKQNLKFQPHTNTLVRIQNRPVKSSVKCSSIISKTPIMALEAKNYVVAGLKNPIRIHNPHTLSLPPSITIKRATTTKQIAFANSSKLKRKQSVGPKKGVGEVLTVELDDDEGLPSTSNPQWYLRPEDQESPKKTEEDNNKEPETTNFIEITIEDSPVKPIANKRTCEVGTELAITIDDSPVKPLVEKKNAKSNSDDEDVEKSVPHSKKKLEYPKETENKEKDVIEIEVEPIESCNDINMEENPPQMSTVEENKIEESFKDVHNATTSTPKKNKLPLSQKSDDVEIIESSEFHPVYQRFIDLCFQLENSDDMKKIVEKKIKSYYRQVPKQYAESEEFIDMVTSKIIAMKASPEKMYLYIKDIVDELNLQRKIAKAQVPSKEEKSAEPDQFLYGEESEFDLKRRRQIRKLEKTIKKLHRAIQKLEEQEVDFDDEDDSVYLLTERYKERMVRVYAKFCQLTNTKMPSEPRIQIDARPSQPAGPAKRLEKWVNKKVPIGTPLPFPDFHDVLRCVKEANDEDKLGWNEAYVMEEARDLFTRCGKKLQRRRQENEWRSAASRLALDVDPAEKNVDLKKQLEDNKVLATKKETDIFNKYADRQNLLKLEAVEIGDKEADESPVESEDEEGNEDENVSLENKEKRKERLKRLLHEKSKKDKVEEKENQPTDPEIPVAILEVKEQSEIGENTEIVTNKDEEKPAEVTGELEGKLEKSPVCIEEAHSISDDSNRVESDIDELHLLQKLHSGNEAQTSTLESSDSDSPIAISDTLESSGDNKPKQLSDVISIENSSYSESEIDKEDTQGGLLKKSVETGINSNIEIEYSDAGIEKVHNKTNNDEYNESVEDILLASSEDEAESQNKEIPEDNVCVNLEDDTVSIGEPTAVTEQQAKLDKGLRDINDNAGGDKANSASSVQEAISSVDEGPAKNADNETDVDVNNVESENSNVTGSMRITRIDSTDSSQDAVLEVPLDDSIQAKVTKDAPTNEDVERMDVDEFDNKMENTFESREKGVPVVSTEN